MKRCKHCGEQKPFDDFYADKAARDGFRPECKACTSVRRRAWYSTNRKREIARVLAWQEGNKERYLERQRQYRDAGKRRYREEHLRQAFGISEADYQLLLESQGGGCAICGRKPVKISLHVDHDHETGRIRGLLCFRCNGGIGQLREEPELLLRAVEYLTSEDVSVHAERELAAMVRSRALALRTSAA